MLNKILSELKAKKKTQKELCLFLGIKQSVFSDWKSGRNSSYTKYLPKIAEFLDVSVDYLLGRTDDPNPPKPRLPDELQALLDKQEHEHVLYTLSAGGRNQQMVILSDEEYDWLKATLKTYREQKEKSENQEK